MKRAMGFLLVLSLLVGMLTLPVSAAAPSYEGLTVHTAETERTRGLIGPQWENTNYIVHGIDIGSGGDSTVAVSYYTYSGTDRISGTATVQRQSSSGAWTDTNLSWSFSGTGSAYLNEDCTVSRGSYRVKTTASVYTSSGKFVEKVTVYSQRKTY